jgi:hypothetical protein
LLTFPTSENLSGPCSMMRTGCLRRRAETPFFALAAKQVDREVGGGMVRFRQGDRSWSPRTQRTQRGNARRFILDSDADRKAYLDLVRRSAESFEIEIIGYCVMYSCASRSATASMKIVSMVGDLWSGDFWSDCTLYMPSDRGRNGSPLKPKAGLNGAPGDLGASERGIPRTLPPLKPESRMRLA